MVNRVALTSNLLLTIVLLIFPQIAAAVYTPYRVADDKWTAGMVIGDCRAGISGEHRAPWTSLISPFTDSLNENCPGDDDTSWSFTFVSCDSLYVTYDQYGKGVFAGVPCTWDWKQTNKKTGQSGTVSLNSTLDKSCYESIIVVDTVLSYEPSTQWCRCFDPNALYIPQPDPFVGSPCRLPRDRYFADRPQTCSIDTPSFGDPIYPTAGANRQEISLDISVASEKLTIRYDTTRKVPRVNGDQEWLVPEPPSFGPLWASNLHRIIFDRSIPKGMEAARGSGVWVSMEYMGDKYKPKNPNQDYAIHPSGIYSWEYRDKKNSAIEYYWTYDTWRAGTLLTEILYSNGRTLKFSYSTYDTPKKIAPEPGLLIEISDHFSRTIQFQYELSGAAVTEAQPRIKKVVTNDGQDIGIKYNSDGYLAEIVWPDKSSRFFRYEDSLFKWALTGVINDRKASQSDTTRATFKYDSTGRVKSVKDLESSNPYSVEYGVNKPTWNVVEHIESTDLSNDLVRDHYWLDSDPIQVTNPKGSQSNITTGVIAGSPRVISQTQPAGSGCAASISSISYDINANIVSREDFSGRKTCLAYDTVVNEQKNLETVQVQGFAKSAECPADLDKYVVPTNLSTDKPQRKISTLWHPSWRLQIRRAEPKLITTLVYNGEPDPSNGDQPLLCAPPDARVSGYGPIAVLCKRIEQPTVDKTGSSGFAAAADGAARIWNFTYNRWGQKLTEVDPRNKTSRWDYYEDTNSAAGAEHAIGDLRSATNAAGQVQRYSRYDKAGRLLTSTDANGVVSQYSYTPRGWLKRVNVNPPSGGGAGEVTEYEHYPTGLLKLATLPDGSTLKYDYDDAHRLTDITDSAGNTVHYTLDEMGNRKGEDLKDQSGTLARTITRVFDDLNRLQNITGALQ
jgi:YD repeat-containing protein